LIGLVVVALFGSSLPLPLTEPPSGALNGSSHKNSLGSSSSFLTEPSALLSFGLTPPRSGTAWYLEVAACHMSACNGCCMSLR
jgi:hypothetical protein